jgi:hypothetical protein
MSGSEATSKLKTRYGNIPPELAFEEIIKNRAAAVSRGQTYFTVTTQALTHDSHAH